MKHVSMAFVAGLSLEASLEIHPMKVVGRDTVFLNLHAVFLGRLFSNIPQLLRKNQNHPYGWVDNREHFCV